MTSAPFLSPTIDTEQQGVARALAGRYDVLRELGRGGMSRVFLAWDREARRQVAIKALAPDLVTSIETRERFRREARIAAQLTHPHIVACYDFVWDGAVAAAVMRYVPGQSLAERVRGGRSLPVQDVLRIVVPIADALAHAHRHGVVHRDVKPANILLDEHGAPFLTDFGIATLRTSEQSRAEATRRFGTPEFMSPEQALGDWQADHRSDIYSLGLVAYAALAGRLPFRDSGGILGLAAQRVVADPAPLASLAWHVPARVGRVIDRALARTPRRRWRDATAFATALVDATQPPRRFSWIARLAGLWTPGYDRARPDPFCVVGE